MKSLRILSRRSASLASAVGLLVAVVAPGFMTATVSAAQVTDRSIELSNATAGQNNITYHLTFTTSSTYSTHGAVVLDFCDNSSGPIPGNTCTAPVGFDTTNVTTSTANTTVTPIFSNRGVKIVPSTAYGSSATVDVELQGIHNPSAAGTFYARIVTYDTSADADTYAADGTSLGTNPQDTGGVALSAVDNIAVSAAVQESMTFCVSGQDTHDVSTKKDCSTTTAPTVTLGNQVGNMHVIDSSNVYTGTIWTQISTNAASGAVVNLKSDATGCGGLRRDSDLSACDISPMTTAGTINAGDAKFGLETGTAVPTNGVSTATGTYEAVGSYNASSYFMNYVDGTTGVTSTYGDPVLDTGGKPVNNMNMPLTFGVSASNLTPAGNYSANLSLIATGTF